MAKWFPIIAELQSRPMRWMLYDGTHGNQYATKENLVNRVVKKLNDILSIHSGTSSSDFQKCLQKRETLFSQMVREESMVVCGSQWEHRGCGLGATGQAYVVTCISLWRPPPVFYTPPPPCFFICLRFTDFCEHFICVSC